MPKKPPSRIRYEQSHPVVSFRLDKEHYDKLKEMIGNKSYAEFMRDIIDNVYERYYKKGYAEGWEKCFEDTVILCECSVWRRDTYRAKFRGT